MIISLRSIDDGSSNGPLWTARLESGDVEVSGCSQAACLGRLMHLLFIAAEPQVVRVMVGWQPLEELVDKPTLWQDEAACQELGQRLINRAGRLGLRFDSYAVHHPEAFAVAIPCPVPA